MHLSKPGKDGKPSEKLRPSPWTTRKATGKKDGSNQKKDPFKDAATLKWDTLYAGLNMLQHGKIEHGDKIGVTIQANTRYGAVHSNELLVCCPGLSAVPQIQTSALNSSGFTLLWDAPLPDGGAEVKDYILKVEVSGHDLSKKRDGSSVMWINKTLEPGQRCEVLVKSKPKLKHKVTLETKISVGELSFADASDTSKLTSKHSDNQHITTPGPPDPPEVHLVKCASRAVVVHALLVFSTDFLPFCASDRV